MHEILVIAGEKSGEEHFLSFYDDLIKHLPNASFFGVGGREMKKRGVDCIYDTDIFSTVGFTEAIRRLPFYLVAMRRVVSEVERRKAKHAILIDFQEFNLKLAQKLHGHGVKVFYYVAPQAWIWRQGRCEKLSKYVHNLFTILPFEKDWFFAKGVRNITSCQHPVFKNFKNVNLDFKEVEAIREKSPTILFLPGSRNSEVAELLPLYYRTFKKLKSILPNFKFSIVISDSISLKLNHEINNFDVVYTNSDLNEALMRASFCVSSSGTVNLNCAFFRVPTVVCYKVNELNYFIARDMIGYKGYASLVNIISNGELFPELIQERLSEHNIINEIIQLVRNKSRVNEVKNKLILLYEYFLQGEEYPGAIIGSEIEKDF